MLLSPGQRLGPYEILAKIGEGGMGQVYRGRDIRLNREVAIKILPELFARDPERLARFTREAQTLASLNHPHIAQLYGVTEEPVALVMEFADGEDLSTIVARGPIALADALALARQIADALEAAHEQGIVHRDLKPANINVKDDGTVKVLDFGLAKAMDPMNAGSGRPEGPTHDATSSPTFTAQHTQMGMVLGTAAYMAPEQARGKAVDKRADIWAFGVVLFEMLTGRQTFGGDTISEVMAAVMKDDPDWSRLPSDLPPQVLRLLRRCLVKDPKQRLRDIGDARLLLDDTDTPAPSIVDRAPGPRRRAIGLMPAAALVALGMLASGVTVRMLSREAPSGIIGSPHLELMLPAGIELDSQEFLPVAISPSGTRIVFVASSAGVSRLYERPIDAGEARPLQGTEGASTPFFSPDGRWIGFFADGALKKVTVGGTAVERLCDAPYPRGGSWGSDGYIYFTPFNTTEIRKVPESGGAPVAVTHLDRAAGEISHRWPLVLADADALVFTVWTGPGPDERQIVRQSLSNGERHVLVRGGDTPRYLPQGFLVYGRLDGLFAVRWQPGETEVRDTAPIALGESARMESEGNAFYAVSATGTLVAVPGGAGRYAQRIVWVDRNGRIEPLQVPERDYESVSISPDETRALLQIREGAMGLWLYDFARRTTTPLVTAGGSSQTGVWTPDGQRVIYRGTRRGTRDLWWRAADGSDDEQRLTVSDGQLMTPSSVTPNGRIVLLNEGGRSRSAQIFTVRLDGPLPATPHLVGDGNDGQLSPDGKWMAYEAVVGRRTEVFVQPFPGSGPRTQISVEGGIEPLWSRDGRELYYQSDDWLMAVGISTSPAFAASPPRPLVQGRFRFGPNSVTSFSIGKNGRFLRVQQAQPETPLDRLEVVIDWVAKVGAAATAAK